jgi:hypothetical protein
MTPSSSSFDQLYGKSRLPERAQGGRKNDAEASFWRRIMSLGKIAVKREQ